jgi:tetratricopeptide (TPR) repeat protein
VRLAPDAGWAHLVMGKVRWFRDEFREAEKSLAEAVRLEPENSDHRWMQVDNYLALGAADKALAAADAAVRLAPGVGGIEASRGTALYHLGRKDEAEASFRRALSLDPSCDVAHAGLGRIALARGKAEDAVGRFRDALRLDPQDEWARQGLVDALKARYPVYGVFVRYFEWSRTLDPRVRMGLTVGVVLLAQGLRVAGKSAPSSLSAVLGTAVLLVAFFVFLTWLSRPVFSLLLRMSPEGRLLLTDDETRCSTAVGLLLAGALLFGGAAAATGMQIGLFLSAATCVVALPSVMSVFSSPPGRMRATIAAVTSVALSMGVVGGIAVLLGGKAWAALPSLGLGVLLVMIFYDVAKGLLRP